MTVASVELWGRRVGAVQIEDGYAAAVFQYDPEFARSGIQVAPLTMPLREQPYEFTGLGEVAFHGLPGLLADSLPDRFGTALIEAWLARQGRSMRDFNSVDRLCYVGRRAMGALEFKPVIGPRSSRSKAIDVNALVELASAILTRRGKFSASFADDDLTRSVTDILLVGTSAGGARAKAVVAYNPETKEVRSGQVDVDPGFEHWILKFDGVSGNDDKDLHQPRDGQGGRHRHDRVPHSGGGRAPALYDQAFRPGCARRQTPHAVSGRPPPLRLHAVGRSQL